MGPANALSRKDTVDTDNDNQEITLLKNKDQYFHICTLDTALANKISLSSKSDPIAVGFWASTCTATDVNGQLRYFVSFVLNTYAFILCVVLQLYSFTQLYSLLLHNKIHYIFRDRTDSHLSLLHCITRLR